jgi:hypothetical protein
MARQIAKKDESTSMTEFNNEKPDYVGDETRGQEGVGVDDVTIPRIGILQDLSPQIKKTKPEYIEGAEAGLLFNNITSQVYGKSIVIIPVIFRKEWIIWRDRDSGGGFRGAYASESEAAEAMSKLEDAAMCEVKDTGQHFVLIVDSSCTHENQLIEEAVISLSGGTMAASRQLNSLAKIAGGDRFSRAYRAEAVLVDGAKGEYYSIKFHPLGYVSENLYKAGETMYEAIKAGSKDVSRSDGADKVKEAVEAEEF